MSTGAWAYPEGRAMKAALKTPEAEGSTAAYGGGNRRDWFQGVGGRGAAFSSLRR